MATTSTIPADRPGGCFATVVFALLLVAGGWVLWQFFYDPYKLLAESRKWERTPCVIVKSEISTTDAPNRLPRRRLVVRYVYWYAGKWHTSNPNQVWFVPPEPDDEEYLKRYPVKSTAVCYVNPKDPKEAVLERGFKPYLLVALFPLGLALTGLVGLAVEVIGHVRRPHRPASHATERHMEGQRRAPAGDQPIVRRGARGIRAALVAVLLAVAWNAPFSFLAREVVASWSDGLPGCHGIFLTLFAVPFMLVGVVMALVAAYLGLRVFAPRPKLRIAHGVVPLGGEVEVSWRFKPGIGQVKRVGVYLEGREEATYEHDDAEYIDSEAFASVTLVDTTDPAVIRRGEARAVVPADAVPSLSSENNRIAWVVRLSGQVRGWPDIHEEVEITVVPALATAATPPQGASA